MFTRQPRYTLESLGQSNVYPSNTLYIGEFRTVQCLHVNHVIHWRVYDNPLFTRQTRYPLESFDIDLNSDDPNITMDHSLVMYIITV